MVADTTKESIKDIFVHKYEKRKIPDKHYVSYYQVCVVLFGEFRRLSGFIGYLQELMDGWINKWMNEWINEEINKELNELMNK